MPKLSVKIKRLSLTVSFALSLSFPQSKPCSGRWMAQRDGNGSFATSGRHSIAFHSRGERDARRGHRHARRRRGRRCRRRRGSFGRRRRRALQRSFASAGVSPSSSSRSRGSGGGSGDAGRLPRIHSSTRYDHLVVERFTGGARRSRFLRRHRATRYVRGAVV